MTLSTFIPGQPVPCARPRVVNGRAYTPGDYARWKQGAALLLRAQRVILTGPVWVEMTVYHRRPIGRPPTITPDDWRTGRAHYAIGRGDLDNYVKGLLDAMQDGGVLVNDRQVVHLVASSRYAPEHGKAGIEVSAEELTERE
mgnify:CR=1 FL=1